jgi:hypothetical protein
VRLKSIVARSSLSNYHFLSQLFYYRCIMEACFTRKVALHDRRAPPREWNRRYFHSQGGAPRHQAPPCEWKQWEDFRWRHDLRWRRPYGGKVHVLPVHIRHCCPVAALLFLHGKSWGKASCCHMATVGSHQRVDRGQDPRSVLLVQSRTLDGQRRFLQPADDLIQGGSAAVGVGWLPLPACRCHGRRIILIIVLTSVAGYARWREGY